LFSRSASFIVAGAAGVATLTANSAPSPLYPTYQRLWGLSAFTLTVVFAVYVVALLAALLTVGSLSDQVGRRPVASGALLLLALSMLLFTTANGSVGLMVARTVQGFAVGAATGTITAMILDSGSNERSGSIASSAGPSLGSALGAVLAGALVDFAPFPRQLVFWILAPVYLLLAALVWLIPERAKPESASRSSVWRSLLPSAGLPSATRPVFFALVPPIVASFALSGLYLSLGSSVISTVLGVHSPFVASIVLGVFFCAGMLGTIVAAFWPPRRTKWFFYGTLMFGVLVTIPAMLMSTLPLYLLGSAIAGLGTGAALSFAVISLDDAAPAARRGQVFATMYIVSYVAFSVPALAAGLAVERFGLKPTAVVYGACDVALVGVGMMRLVQARRRSRVGATTG